MERAVQITHSISATTGKGNGNIAEITRVLFFSNECPTPVNSNACADNSKACLIDGTCYANGARRSSTGNGGCEVGFRFVNTVNCVSYFGS